MKWIPIFFTLVLAWPCMQANANEETSLQYFGHAAFKITTPKGKILFIDPWLSNPLNPEVGEKRDPLSKINGADYILITHGHFDHVGDAVALAKKTGAKLVANFELGNNLAQVAGYPANQMGFDTLMNIGGEIEIAEGEVRVMMTQAVHSSSLAVENPKKGEPKYVYGGNAAGFVIRIQDGPTFYHTGDTAYFEDMTTIGRFWKPDVALVNIGGHFGMSDAMAVEAVRAVGAKLAIPHHFATFPILTKDSDFFASKAKKHNFKVQTMAPGSSIKFKGKKLLK